MPSLNIKMKSCIAVLAILAISIVDAWKPFNFVSRATIESKSLSRNTSPPSPAIKLPILPDGKAIKNIAALVLASFITSTQVIADSSLQQSSTSGFSVTDTTAPTPTPVQTIRDIKLPYEHVNIPLKEFLGKKATLVVNIKLDDPQSNTQLTQVKELYDQFKDSGLNVLLFPTEQGWFEPDDDETVRLKLKEYFGFGDLPRAVVFDKVDLLGQSAHPSFTYWTHLLPTPNGYERITLNYEKILLDCAGNPVRRYPRKFVPSDISADIQALVQGECAAEPYATSYTLPAPTPVYEKVWREAKREAVKSEYAFRYNYNYYNSPQSIYKYNPQNDAVQ